MRIRLLLSGSVGEQDRRRIDQVLKEFEDLMDGRVMVGSLRGDDYTRCQGHINCWILYETQLAATG